MPCYVVQSWPVMHDGKEYGEGECLELPEKDAQSLLSGGFVLPEQPESEGSDSGADQGSEGP